MLLVISNYMLQGLYLSFVQTISLLCDKQQIPVDFVISSISEKLSFEHLRAKDKYLQRFRPWDERFMYASY